MNILQKIFQLSKQKEHGYHINYENTIFEMLTSWRFPRGGSRLIVNKTSSCLSIGSSVWSGRPTI